MRKIAVFILRIGISVLILLFIFRNIDKESFFKTIGSSDKKLVLFAFLTYGLSYLFCLFRWQGLLKASDLHLPLKRVFISFAGGTFFNLFLPSTIGGDLVRSIDLAAHTRKTKEVVATVLLDRLSGYVGLVLICLVALAFGGRIVADRSVLLAVSLVTLVLHCVLLVLFNRFIYSKVNQLFHSPQAGRIREMIKNVHQQMHIFRGHRRLQFASVGVSIAVQLVLPLSFYLTALSLGIKVKMAYFFLFIPIIGAITMLPISIGGLGVRDASTIFFLSKVGLSKDIALAISLINFSFILVYAAAGGLTYVLTLSSRRIQPHPSPHL